MPLPQAQPFAAEWIATRNRHDVDVVSIYDNA